MRTDPHQIVDVILTQLEITTPLGHYNKTVMPTSNLASLKTANALTIYIYILCADGICLSSSLLFFICLNADQIGLITRYQAEDALQRSI